MRRRCGRERAPNRRARRGELTLTLALTLTLTLTVTQLALVAYVPDAEHNKSASKIDVQVWGDIGEI